VLFVSFDDAAIDVIALDEALDRLTKVDALSEQIVELRFLGGLSLAEVAQTLEMPLRSVERRWTFARAWLHAELA
jgi:RNA polymerase sigma factor (sigma-70 family)